jgi:hypothetical protein
MLSIFRYISTLVGCLAACCSYAQQSSSDGKQTVTMSAPLQLPLITLVPSAVIRLRPQDSLARVAYVKNKVKSISKIRVRENSGQIDTLEYTELDRQGNRAMVYNPAFHARTLRRYDSQNRLLEVVQLPHFEFPYEIREVLDPVRNTYTAYHDLSDAPNHLYRSVAHRYHGDTLVGTAELHQPEMRVGYTLKRIVTRRYTSGPDTTRIDLFGYDEAGKAQVYEGLYYIFKNKAPVEAGSISYQQALQHLLDTSAQIRQLRSHGASDAAIIQQQVTRVKGLYQPTSRWWYDQKQQLIRQESNSLAKASRSSSSKQQPKSNSMIITESTSSQTVFHYNFQGRVVREEIQSIFPPKADSAATPTINRHDLENTYSPNGLLMTETWTVSNQVSRYEYRYTYF